VFSRSLLSSRTSQPSHKLAAGNESPNPGGSVL
jgi:hypothetical protein